MVLTNFELWAADGSSASSLPLDIESNTHSRHLNPFNPRVVPQLNSSLNHLSSNGYYGFSYVNAAHDMELNNNNNVSNINHNNNNSTSFNFMANDVNGINSIAATKHTHTSAVNLGSSANAAGHAANVTRCKKRFLVMNDAAEHECTATNNKNCYSNNYEVSVKRCRFDDDFAAQYCNDFFQLPSTQIATQSCLMDTEESPQQQMQHKTDVTMFEHNINNIEQCQQNVIQHLQQQYQEQSQNHHSTQSLPSHHYNQQQVQQQQEHQQQQSPSIYQQQQHYQGHLHRANRDVSRCMLSHMI